MSRPWHDDAFLKGIVEKAAYSLDSPAQMIQHSVDLRGELQRISAERQPALRQQQNLRAAKHRLHFWLHRAFALFNNQAPGRSVGNKSPHHACKFDIWALCEYLCIVGFCQV